MGTNNPRTLYPFNLPHDLQQMNEIQAELSEEERAFRKALNTSIEVISRLDNIIRGTGGARYYNQRGRTKISTLAFNQSL